MSAATRLDWRARALSAEAHVDELVRRAAQVRALHTATDDGRCCTCDEPCPCPTLAALDPDPAGT